MEDRIDQGKKTNRAGGERRADDALRIADALKRGGRISLRVHGNSMQPWVRPKDIALIRQISIENVRCGDVVLFRREGTEINPTSAANRKLVLEYYRGEKKAKIDHRRSLAEQYGIALNALRIRAHRIRAALQECVETCIKQATA